VVNLKYQSPQISKLPSLQTWGKGLLVKIHVITGWTIPTDSGILTALIDQFQKKLLEDYPNLNLDEIEFAFRSGGTTVKDWGKAMNLALIDEVLKPYVSTRYELSLAEERAKNSPTQRIYTEAELDNIHRADVEAFYQRCLKGITPPKELPEYYKTILVKDGLMGQDDELGLFFVGRINSGIKNIYVKE
jgi:hypothetical protein